MPIIQEALNKSIGSADLAERPASMQAWIPAFAGMTNEVIDADRQPYSLNPCLPVIYGQEVLYAARGQEARSRDGQEVLYAARRLQGCRW